jgi:hypothetical protein
LKKRDHAHILIKPSFLSKLWSKKNNIEKRGILREKQKQMEMSPLRMGLNYLGNSSADFG